MYKADPGQPMLMEGDARNEKDHFFVEEYLKQKRVPATIFRPLYIYGPFGNKDSYQYIMDRVVRDRPVYLPTPGNQVQYIYIYIYIYI